ncbi:MAG: hypothetical protein JXQ99_04905 [Hyphomicrobiaceae bacterium]
METACDDRLVGIMVTNPNTLGLFEEQIEKLVQLVHGCSGLVYGDGANLNALTGIARPGDFGIDLMHFNLHKTFATPHGGGGPGSGPVGASQALAPFLSGPIVERSQGSGEGKSVYGLVTPEHAIGRMVAFHGNFGMFVRAWADLRRLGDEGLRSATMHAVLNANDVRASLTSRVSAAQNCGMHSRTAAWMVTQGVQSCCSLRHRSAVIFSISFLARGLVVQVLARRADVDIPVETIDESVAIETAPRFRDGAIFVGEELLALATALGNGSSFSCHHAVGML